MGLGLFVVADVYEKDVLCVHGNLLQLRRSLIWSMASSELDRISVR